MKENPKGHEGEGTERLREKLKGIKVREIKMSKCKGYGGQEREKAMVCVEAKKRLDASENKTTV